MRKIIFSFLVQTDANFCSVCGKPMNETDYSIEHIIPWRYDDDAWSLYFDLQNIAFAHQRCNSSGGRKNTERAIDSRPDELYTENKGLEANGMRRCSGYCKNIKKLEEFPKNKYKRCGRSTECKECRKLYMREYRKNKRLTQKDKLS